MHIQSSSFPLLFLKCSVLKALDVQNKVIICTWWSRAGWQSCKEARKQGFLHSKEGGCVKTQKDEEGLPTKEAALHWVLWSPGPSGEDKALKTGRHVNLEGSLNMLPSKTRFLTVGKRSFKSVKEREGKGENSVVFYLNWRYYCVLMVFST